MIHSVGKFQGFLMLKESSDYDKHCALEVKVEYFENRPIV
jgi:hypothetical protein